MSDFISELKAAWVGSRQRAFHQSTRGIVTPEDRRALEEEFDRKIAEVKAKAYAQGVGRTLEVLGTATAPGDGLLTLIGNPYRKDQGNE